MSATAPGVVESIMARCLVEPAFLDAVRADPVSALASYPLAKPDLAAFRTADFARLRQFSGFIGKVQHNFLWESFPATRKLLGRQGIELEVFARYRSLQLEPGLRRAAQDDKIRSFLSFLEEQLAGSVRGLALKAVMRHERALWEVRQAASALPTAPRRNAIPMETLASLPWRQLSRLVPAIDGMLRLEAFDCDPVVLADRVLADAPERRLRRRPRWLAYRADPSSGRLRTLAVETLLAMTLLQVDGRRRVGAIVAAIRRRSLAGAPPAAFRPLFEEAARQGLISLAMKDG